MTTAARSFLTAALLAILCLPAAAHAGEAFTIGEGDSPHLIVDAGAGTAHVVWADEVADVIRTCEVPRGATACTDEESLAPLAGSPDEPFMLRGAGMTIYIVVPHYVADEIWLYTSTDNGATWGAAQKIYDETSNTDATEPILNAAGNEVVVASWNPSRFVYSARLDGTDSAVNDEPALSNGGNGSLVYDLQVARAGGTYISTANDLDDTFFWTSANPNNVGGWSGPNLVGDGDDSRLAGDGTNAYLLSHGGGVSSPRAEIRKWNGASFGAPVVVADEQPYINDVTVSPSGAVGAIWRKNESPSNRMRFALSTDGGATFTLATIGFEDIVMANMDVALAGDNRGFVVYEGTSVPSTGAKRFIRMRSTDTVAEPPPAGAGGGGGPAPTPTTTPAPRPATTPSTPLRVGRRVVTRVDGATITVGLPRGCIPAGRPFTATLSWRRARRKGNKFVRIFRTDFFIGTRRMKADRSAPFRQTLRIPSPRAGQTYRFRARAYIRVRRGRSPKKSIFSTLRVCG